MLLKLREIIISQSKLRSLTIVIKIRLGGMNQLLNKIWMMRRAKKILSFKSCKKRRKIKCHREEKIVEIGIGKVVREMIMDLLAHIGPLKLLKLQRQLKLRRPRKLQKQIRLKNLINLEAQATQIKP